MITVLHQPINDGLGSHSDAITTTLLHTQTHASSMQAHVCTWQGLQCCEPQSQMAHRLRPLAMPEAHPQAFQHTFICAYDPKPKMVALLNSDYI
jgi:hypothetical protein